MHRTLVALALLAALTGSPALAADWGGIDPGTTTMAAVRDLYGTASRATTSKVDGYDSARWIYEGRHAPGGIERMLVDFGMLVGGRFRADVVRALTLEPKPGIFNTEIVLTGWGIPTRESPQGQPIAFFYESGLIIYFAEDGNKVTSLIFTPRQPAPPR